MENVIREIMRKTYIKYGDNIFLDNNRLKAYLSDLLSEYPVERKRLSIAINENIVEYIIKDGDSSRKCIYIDILRSTYGLPVAIAGDIIETIYYAIYGQEDSDKQYSTNRNSNEKLPAARDKFTAESVKKIADNLEDDQMDIYSDRDRKTAKALLVCILIPTIISFIVGIGSMLAKTITNDHIENDELENMAADDNCIQNFVSCWDDKNMVSLLNWNVPFKVFNITIHNCEKFMLNFEIEGIQDGNPYGEWYVYIRDLNNNWIHISSFVAQRDNNPVTVEIVSTTGVFADFNAIALVRNSQQASNHSYNFESYDFLIDDK